MYLKKFFSIISLLLVSMGYCKAVPVDTVYVVVDKYMKVSKIKKRIENVSWISNDTLHLGRKQLSLTDTTRFLNLVFYKKILITDYIGKYYIFFTKGSQIIVEATYGFESFDGPYKEYHKNGGLKAQGVLNYGKKIGTWKYYSRRGKLRKEISY